MLDAALRPLIDAPLNAASKVIARHGISASAVTLTGLAVGLAAIAAIAWGWFEAGLALIVLNRVLDGLDGAVARATQATDAGGFLDIVADYVFYAGIPLAFALADPASNALPAAALLASFCLTCSSFLAFAAIAAKRGLSTVTQGHKSFFYSKGLVEGTETILFFLLMAAVPGWFATLAWLLAVLCVVTAAQRTLLAYSMFR